MYEEGLRPELVGDRLGSPRLAIREESRRLIEVAKDVGDFISYDTLKSLGLRVKKRSGENVVLFYKFFYSGHPVGLYCPLDFISLM